MIIKIKTDMCLSTNGQGLWTNKSRVLVHKRMELDILQDDGHSLAGELRVYFAKKDWDVRKHGLIYTDPGWLSSLRYNLEFNGLMTRKQALDVDYSEQGMQGDNYVSLDVGDRFIKYFIDGWYI